MRIVIRLRLRRGDYVPVCPARLQYLAFSSLGGPSVSSSSSSPLPSSFPASYTPLRRYFVVPPIVTVYFVLVIVVVAVLERGKKKIRDDCRRGNRKDGSGEFTIESREREVRGGRNCIRSNHIRERHRALRNQLNGEKLVVWREIADPRWVKEREKAKIGLGGSPTADSVKWMKRGKTKRQTAKDRLAVITGSLDIHIYFSSNSFFSPFPHLFRRPRFYFFLHHYL